MGHMVSSVSISRLLKSVGYRLQSNQKKLEGTNHPNRDAQFKYFNEELASISIACVSAPRLFKLPLKCSMHMPSCCNALVAQHGFAIVVWSNAHWRARARGATKRQPSKLRHCCKAWRVTARSSMATNA